MGNFFNPEKGIWAWLSTAVDVAGLSIAWLLLCMPLVTIGPATAALYHAVVKYVRTREQGAFTDFFRSFYRNLRVGVLVTLPCLAAAAALGCGYIIMLYNRSSQVGGVLYGAYYVAMLLPAGVLCWLFPLLGRFEFRAGQLFATAVQLALRHLPSTVVLVLMTLETASLCVRRWWPALFMPALVMLLASLFLERVFQKYVPELAQEAGDADRTGEEDA